MEVIYKNEKVLVEIIDEIDLGTMNDYNTTEKTYDREVICLKWKIKNQRKIHYTLAYQVNIGVVKSKEIYESRLKDMIRYGNEIDYKIIKGK